MQLAGQFVLIPMVVVLIAVSVFLLFGFVASDEQTPEQYLREIRSGSASRRWQAAFELSRSLRREGARAATLVPEIAETLRWARNEDPQVRRYLARALGHVGAPAAVPVLLESLRDIDADTRLYATEALGVIGDPKAAGAIAALLTDEDPGVRKQAVHSLGRLNAPGMAEAVAPVLQDPVVDVRWNAALTLARGADRRGLPVLMEMTDRQALASVPDIRPGQQEAAILAAVSALGVLQAESARPRLEQLVRDDPSMEIREAARRVLEGMQSGGGAL